jgi:3-hydroxy acid dehydrogenase/malonic semialdehyde reductase
MSVFISGASSGIGEACAKAFAAAKQDLVLIARRKDRLEGVAEALRKKHGVNVHALECDVQKRSSIEALFKNHAEVIQSVSILINNAGLGLGRGPLQEGIPDDWDMMVDTNVKGFLYITRAFLPQLLAQAKTGKKGHIVNMGSAAGHWVYPGGGVYCATKYAVRALTEGLRLDLLGTGVRVTEIAPGMVETDFSRIRFKGDVEKAKAVYQGMTPLSATDVAEAVLWCVERPAHVNIQSVVMFPTDQASVTSVHRRE